MTVSLKHKFTSAKSDSADTSLIRPSNWNDEHDLTLATDRLLGRDTTGAGVAEEITVAGGLEFTGTGGIQRSALTGDVTASAGSNTTTIANDAVTYAKIQNVSTNNRILGRSSAGAGDIEELSGGTGLTLSSGTLSVTTNTYQPLDADLTAIAVLAGTSGILTKTAANTWSLDTTSYSATGHTHSIANVTNLQTTLDGKAASSHTHIIGDVTGLQTALDGKQAAGSYAAASHTHTIANVTGLQTALDGKQAAGSYAAASHTHTIANVTGLQTALDGKQATGSYAITNGANTFSDSQTISTGGFAAFYVSGGAGSGRLVVYRSSGTNRWAVGASNNSESGSNAGSNFEIVRYNDAGSTLGTPLSISRSTGNVTLESLSGTGSRTVTAGAAGVLSASSDSRLKEEITTQTLPGLSEILQLNPRAYKWLDDISIRGDSAAVEVGFFANEVAPIIPSAAPMGNDGYYGFNDRAVIAALVNAVKELSARVEALENAAS